MMGAERKSIMKKVFLFICILIFAALACDMTVTVTSPTSMAPTQKSDFPTAAPATLAPTQLPATSIPATSAPTLVPTLVPTAVPTIVQPSAQGVEVSTGPLSVTLPNGLASGARGSQFPRSEGPNVAPWDVTPGHTVLKLEGYILQDRTRQPQIYVYPAMEYVQMRPAAFEAIHRLDNILANSGDFQLPAVPFFNEQQAFASNIQMISFQNGRGVRFLTEYAQYPVSANNHDLFYHFEGVTNDGLYYVIAILPISAPILADTSDAGAPLPAGGVPYPYYANAEADMQAYYNNVIALLNAISPDAFTPSINQLDLLIQSMRINP
jgi:hypothetical protein